MSQIGWGDGYPPGSSGPFFAGRSGSLPSNDDYTTYFCGVDRSHSTASFSYTWAPTASDPDPVDWSGMAYGAFGLSVRNTSSGTLTISAVVDGVPATNQLKLALVSTGTYGYGYGNVAWVPASFTPEQRSIGWGAPGGVNNTPTAGGFAVANAGATDAFGQTAVCGVVGSYGTASYTHEWLPAVPGEASAVASASTGYGAYTLTITQNRAAGTVRVSAVVDGLAATTVCVLTVAYSEWSPVNVYGGFAWATEAAPSTDFWTLFIGTEET